MRLIDANTLKKALHNFFDGKIIDEPTYILRDVFCYINNAPTVDLKDIYQEGHYDGHLEGYTKAINEERPQGEWISVNEKLPEKCKEVIVTDIETSGTYVSRYIGNGYWECDNGPYKHRIIAWQPLPEPYMRGEEK